MSKYIIPKRNAKKIQEKLREDKVVMDYDEEELQYLGSSIGAATYNYDLEESQKYGTVLDEDKDNIDDEYEGSESFASDSDEDSYEDIYTDATDSDEAEESETQFLLGGAQVELEKATEPKMEIVRQPVKKKAHWKDRIKCQICGGEYTRSAVSAHRGTKKHQIYAKANKKFLNIMQGN